MPVEGSHDRGAEMKCMALRCVRWPAAYPEKVEYCREVSWVSVHKVLATLQMRSHVKCTWSCIQDYQHQLLESC